MRMRIVALAVALVSTVVLCAEWGTRARRADARVAASEPPASVAPPRLVLDSGDEDESVPSSEPVPDAAAAAARAEAPARGDAVIELGTVHGRVLDVNGRPIRPWKPYVALIDAAGARRGGQASDEGFYSITGLAPGSLALSVGATGYRPLTETVALDAEQPIVRRDVVLERAVALPVFVRTPDGRDLYETDEGRQLGILRPFFVATSEAPGPTIPEAVRGGADTIGVGSFWEYGPLWESAGPGCVGVLLLAGDLPAFVSLTVGARVVESRQVQPGTERLEFVVDPAALRDDGCRLEAFFRAQDTGEPLTLDVEVDPLDRTFGVRAGVFSAALPPGDHRITTWALGYARLTREVTLVPGQVLDLGEILLPPELVIEGHLLDDEGRPVVGRLILGTVDEAGRISYREHHYLETDETGFYRVRGLVPGRYVLRTAGDDEVVRPGRGDPPTVWVSGVVPVSTLGGSVTGFDIQLVKAAFLVLHGSDTWPAGTRCRVLDARGDAVRWTTFTTGFVPRFALMPGEYAVVVCDREWKELERRAVEVGAGVTELDVTR